jgi:hypothetical protein
MVRSHLFTFPPSPAIAERSALTGGAASRDPAHPQRSSPPKATARRRKGSHGGMGRTARRIRSARSVRAAEMVRRPGL